MLAIIISMVVAVVLVIADQVSKYIVASNMEVGDSIEVIPGVFNFTYVQNDGAAFGTLDDARWVFMILSTVAIIAILVYLFWKKPKNIFQLSALTLIVAGGIGNMIDRIALGYVIDFLDFCLVPAIWAWVFNVADSCVTIGCAMLALWMIIEIIKESKKTTAAKGAGVMETRSSFAQDTSDESVPSVPDEEPAEAQPEDASDGE